MDQFFNKANEDKLECNTNTNKNQCDVENSDTPMCSEVHSTDLQDRAKMLEFWSKQYKVDVNNKKEEETLLLMCLGLYESDSCIMRLIEIECDVNATNGYGKSPLHLAIKRPTLIVAIELIERGANINAQDNQNTTPLHYVVLTNHEAMCMLLYYGADVCVGCCNMESPLSMALTTLESGRSESIHTLMNYYEDKDLYEEINRLICKDNSDGLFLLRNSRLFKLVWTYIDHDSLTEFYIPFLLTYLYDCNFPTNEWCECLQLILQSDSIIDLIEQFNYTFERQTLTFVHSLLYALQHNAIEFNKRINIICMVLSLGIKICLNDFNDVFEFYGFDTELKAFIYAGDYDTVYTSTSFSFALLPFILALSDDFSIKNIVSLLKKQILYRNSINNNRKQNHIASALKSFSINSHAKAELLATCQRLSNNCETIRLLNEIPEFPSLLELSRNQIYLSVRNGYQVKKPYHFHNAVNNLLLPQKLKDVIVFKTPIY